ncbi:hypothetical protein [Dictyobacter alpinus]|uniref:hypothetical protein n=1 Tax=Dictyobacter alpinus TaxID=2014873 RepID=UPI000F81F6B7|nr:hypothetical protein [Dictyobacter alpinus]
MIILSLRYVNYIVTGKIFIVSFENIFYWLLLPLYLVAIYALIDRQRFLSRLGRKRAMALSHQADFPSIKLSEPHDLTMISTSQLVQRPHKFIPMISTALVVFLFLALVWIYVLFLNNSSHIDVSFVVLTLIIFSVVVIVLMIFFFFLSGIRYEGLQRITLTDEGITVRSGDGQVNSLRWHEIQLFATNHLPGQVWAWKRRPLAYEVSSDQTLVRWVLASDQQLRSKHVVLEPDMNVAEYHTYMQLVSELVAARTGLPLYDFDADFDKKIQTSLA